jgi:hypothetical protein
MTNTKQENIQRIRVLEIRNYLIKPNTADMFSHYFNTHFVAPMNKLGGYTLGQFKISGVNDRFVWFRGFTDMKTRLKFLNDFYINSPTWKEFGKGANEMMINSDNVYLLRPLYKTINTGSLKTNKAITVIDFYVCNSTLDNVINLFNTLYIPFLKTLGIDDNTIWVSEMAENDFPRLPVFQDKNLLVSITNYKNKKEYQARQKQINAMNADLKKSIQELITTHNSLILLNQNPE